MPKIDRQKGAMPLHRGHAPPWLRLSHSYGRRQHLHMTGVDTSAVHVAPLMKKTGEYFATCGRSGTDGRGLRTLQVFSTRLLFRIAWRLALPYLALMLRSQRTTISISLLLAVTACGCDNDTQSEPTIETGRDLTDTGLVDLPGDDSPLEEPTADVGSNDPFTEEAPSETDPCPGHDETASELLVSPYLQAATPTSIWVVWETDTGAESRVEWGTSEDLGERRCGSTVDGQLRWPTVLHETHLDELEPATRYYYQVHTGAVASDVSSFVTPPVADSETSFRFVAMSDMQRDDSRPTQFRSIVEDGVIPFVTDEYSTDPAAALGFIIVAGDLVDNGWLQNEWINDFFAQGAQLFAQVTLYPALGNHEGNTPLYPRYFHLPGNGTPGFEEHWYYTDYSNVRLIGLDSNEGYRTLTQLDWLDAVLADACAADSIDFVFAQLHHPHLSELWIPGEIDFTGHVVERLEAFSAECGKPSAHLFGHTHGYSRGQSRDHTHLMVNVATAGGAIDRWGHFEQADYDEFTVSQDEYGFVLFEVEAGTSPSVRLKRISRGDADETLDNVVRDEVTIRRFNTAPNTPTPSPVAAACDQPLTLEASGFEDADDDAHYASHWQMSGDCDGFSTLTVDRWRQAENWYADEDTQAGDGLTDEQVKDLPAPGSYCWRVRYRDDGLAWSDWSAAQPVNVPACD